MLARLLQVDAIAWAVQHDLALLAATLRADASMHRRAEALLFSSFADGAGQEISLRLIMACEKSCRSSALGRQALGFGYGLWGRFRPWEHMLQDENSHPNRVCVAFPLLRDSKTSPASKAVHLKSSA